jgi:hypothetical protein
MHNGKLFVDTIRLDEVREVIDCEIAERVLCTGRSRSMLRRIIADQLGYDLITVEDKESKCFVSSAVSWEERQSLYRVADEENATDAYGKEVEILCARSLIGFNREDAEIAVLCRILDHNTRVTIAEENEFRTPMISPYFVRDLWSQEVELCNTNAEAA